MLSLASLSFAASYRERTFRLDRFCLVPRSVRRPGEKLTNTRVNG